MPRDRLEHVFLVQAEPLGLHDQAFDLGTEQLRLLYATSGFAGGNDASHGRGRHEDALCNERRHNFVGRIWVDLELLAKNAHGGKLVTWPQLASDYSFLYRK